MIITLLTDFGSFYPAQMKAVILSRLGEKARDIVFVDIAHDIPPQDVRAGAFALLSSARYFPPGTIHLAVVDPGVGTERLGLVVESGGQFFVGPDNGLLLPAVRSLCPPASVPQAYKIVMSAEIVGMGLGMGSGMSPGMISGTLGSSPHTASVSNTFHGRDVFAPVAALLASGTSPAAIGPRVMPKDLNFGEAKRTEKGIEATVIYVDRFGNLILNMRSLPAFSVRLQGVKLKKVSTYGQARRIEPLITLGSHGFAEIAVNLGSAAEAFGLKAKDRVELEEI
jgi:S-adenosylmethionine hydrolase